MALETSLLKQMKQLSQFTPEQIDNLLGQLATEADQNAQSDDETVRREGDKKWRRSINLMLLTMWIEHKSTRKGLISIAAKTKEIDGILQSFAAGGEVEAPAPVPQRMPPVGGNGIQPATGQVLGADGTPITDPAQIDAERMMDDVLGPRPGSVAPRQVQRAAGPPAAASGPVMGADGSLITDPAQIEAERMMDDVLGPR